MSGIQLNVSIQRLKQCLKMGVDGSVVVNKNMIDLLEYTSAMSRVEMALQNQELTVEQLHELLGFKDAIKTA